MKNVVSRFVRTNFNRFFYVRLWSSDLWMEMFTRIFHRSLTFAGWLNLKWQVARTIVKTYEGLTKRKKCVREREKVIVRAMCSLGICFLQKCRPELIAVTTLNEGQTTVNGRKPVVDQHLDPGAAPPQSKAKHPAVLGCWRGIRIVRGDADAASEALVRWHDAVKQALTQVQHAQTRNKPFITWNKTKARFSRSLYYWEITARTFLLSTWSKNDPTSSPPWFFV